MLDDLIRLFEAAKESWEAFVAVLEDISPEDPDPIPPNLKRPGRGIRSVSNLTLRRLDLMPWYTSGFQ